MTPFGNAIDLAAHRQPSARSARCRRQERMVHLRPWANWPSV